MSWVQRAKPGDKVVCVDDVESPGRRFPRGKELVRGRTYTINAVWASEHPSDLGHVVFGISEIPRENFKGIRMGYKASRFRPVDPRSTDITVFTDMLTKAPQRVQEVA